MCARHETNDQWLGTSPVDERLIRATLWEPQRTEAAELAGLPEHRRRRRRCSRCRHNLSGHFPLLPPPRFLAPLAFRSAGGGECEVGGECPPPVPLPPLVARVASRSRTAPLFPALSSCPPLLSSPQYVPASRRDVSRGERVS